MANEVTDESVVYLKDTRLSFADHIFEAEIGAPRENGKHKGKIPYRWSANFLTANPAEHKKINKAVAHVIAAQWPDGTVKIKAERSAFRDGDNETWAGYADNWYVSASQTRYGTPDDNGRVANPPKRPFPVIGPRKVKKDDGLIGFPAVGPETIYSGCRVNVKIRFWAQDDPEHGKRVNASIEAVQFARDDVAFGGGKPTNVDDEFDDLGGESVFDDDWDGI